MNEIYLEKEAYAMLTAPEQPVDCRFGSSVQLQS